MASSNLEPVLPPNERFKKLESIANNFAMDKNQPIRRYYRSGAEMIKMADTYLEEENYEKAYILYLKYLTLFIEKVRHHPEFKSVGAEEKKKVMRNVKAVMPKSEELKKLIKAQYENEYSDYLSILEIQKEKERQIAEELRKLKIQQEGENLRKEISKYHDEKAKTVQMQRDMELAMYHQLKFTQEQEKLIPEKKSENVPIPNNVQIPDRSTKPQIPDRSTKPSSMSLYSESGGLRQISVPTMLMAKFLSLADKNTSNNIETGGVLAGKLSQNKFKITNLIIPQQTGTSDSCTTSGEEAVWDYQEKNDLLSLGWIHTHPSQTSFLSSVDLHTQFSYQVMLPEAIAIVIAPKYNETGFFSLTPDHGLDFIANCTQTGFHPHPKDPPLFAELGHVVLDQDSDITVVDFR